jgi:DNA-binding MarR family transcriptional regulator
MTKNTDTKEEQFNIQLKKLNDFIAELLSDAPILIETEDNLTMSQLRVLLLLKINNRMNMTQISACLTIHVSTATGLVDRMIAKKLIQREMNEDDRRVILCSLSEKGQKITDGIWKIVWENARSLAEYVTPDELNMIGKSIDILQRAWTKRKEELGRSISGETIL